MVPARDLVLLEVLGEHQEQVAEARIIIVVLALVVEGRLLFILTPAMC